MVNVAQVWGHEFLQAQIIPPNRVGVRNKKKRWQVPDEGYIVVYVDGTFKREQAGQLLGMIRGSLLQ